MLYVGKDYIDCYHNGIRYAYVNVEPFDDFFDGSLMIKGVKKKIGLVHVIVNVFNKEIYKRIVKEEPAVKKYIKNWGYDAIYANKVKPDATWLHFCSMLGLTEEMTTVSTKL